MNMTDEPKPQEQDDDREEVDYDNNGDPDYYDRYTAQLDDDAYMSQSDRFSYQEIER